MLALWEQQAADRGEPFSFTLDAERLLILSSDGLTPARPRFVATVLAQDPELDLAVLQVIADAQGTPIDRNALDLPWVPFGNSPGATIGAIEGLIEERWVQRQST